LALSSLRREAKANANGAQVQSAFSFRVKDIYHLYSNHHNLPPDHPHLTMFRTALVRSARCLAQAAPRAQVSVARRVVPSSFVQSRSAAPSAMVPSIRFYSAHAGLSQDEVQGRILDLLKNFDKVRHAAPRM